MSQGRRSAEQLWERYRDATVPANAGPAQLRETRMAFFAGAYSAFGHVLNSLDDGEETTEEDVKTVTDLYNEIELALAKAAQVVQ